MTEGLGAVITVELPDQDEGEEDDDDQDDGDRDAHQDGGVIRVSGDGLRPRGFTKLVLGCVRSNLRKHQTLNIKEIGFEYDEPIK